MSTSTDESAPHEKSVHEEFDTGLSKIRHEIKSRLVSHGLFGTVTNIDGGDAGAPKTTIQIVVKARTAARTFDRKQIEDCRLRVGGPVLAGIVSMIEELSAPGRAANQRLNASTFPRERDCAMKRSRRCGNESLRNSNPRAHQHEGPRAMAAPRQRAPMLPLTCRTIAAADCGNGL